ncbi:MAG: tRNA (adenosine(37)-N6)-threonylcarbamoyltransferase complex dimerization subunit type 1 TsaB, partial [Pseudomonadota bacterium]
MSTSAPTEPALALIDATGEACAAVIARPSGVVAAVSETMRRGQAERLGPILREALEAAKLAPSELAAVAVVVGPGSFTGVRVGVAGARALALAIGRPCIGVTGFDAVAAQAAGRIEAGPAVIAFGRPDRRLWRVAGADWTLGALEQGDDAALAARAAELGGPPVLGPAAGDAAPAFARAVDPAAAAMLALSR